MLGIENLEKIYRNTEKTSFITKVDNTVYWVDKERAAMMKVVYRSTENTPDIQEINELGEFGNIDYLDGLLNDDNFPYKITYGFISTLFSSLAVSFSYNILMQSINKMFDKILFSNIYSYVFLTENLLELLKSAKVKFSDSMIKFDIDLLEFDKSPVSRIEIGITLVETEDNFSNWIVENKN